MNNILNLCRSSIAFLMNANTPPFSIGYNKKDESKIYIQSAGGGYIARIWVNGREHCNAGMVINALNNNHRFAAALAIAVQHLGKDHPALSEIEKCFENEKLNFEQVERISLNQ